MQLEPTSLWRHGNFVRLWAGQTVSAFGSAIGSLALPLTAVAVLDATPLQMGVLGALGTTPALLFALFAGVWVDRVRRRPLLIGVELGRAMLLVSIPLAAALGVLRIEQLYLVSFLAGSLGLLFNLAYTTFLPAVVEPAELVEGNSRLAISDSVASIAGPGLAGWLVHLITAPLAIAVDAVSFGVSALCLGLVRVDERHTAAGQKRGSVWHDVVEGLETVVKQPLLRAMTISSAIGSLTFSLQGAVLVLFLSRELQLAPGILGMIFASGGIASLVGAVLAGRAARRFGVGPVIIGGTLLVGIGRLFIPVAGGPLLLSVGVLIGAQTLAGIGAPIYSINQVSLRQAITPHRILGRVNATRQFVVFGVGPFGALLGGVLGELFGLRTALLCGALGMLVAFLWVYLSPVRDVRETPTLAPEGA